MDQLQRMLQTLDAGAARRTSLENYYAGTQPLAFLTADARTAIGSRFSRMASNIPRVAVAALAERLRVTGLTVDGRPAPQLWADWLANDLDQCSGVVHREALVLGECFVVVWADAAGDPLVSIESAHQVAVERDPATRQVVAAVKRWTTGTPDQPTGTAIVLYTPDQIVRMHSASVGATTGFVTTEVLANPFGQVPVVPFAASDRILGDPVSELDDLLPLVDAQNKVLLDMMVSSEYVGRPRRWATGVEPKEEVDEDGRTREVNPFPEANRMMLSEDPAAKFGQLDAGDLAGYQGAVSVLQAQLSAVSGLPPHYLGVHGDQPASADALRASEASLTARAEARQRTFGRSWEQVARLMVAVRTGQDPATVRARVSWADPATRSVAQEADAAVKLVQAGVLPREYALRKLGYSDAEITEITTSSTATTSTI